MATWHCKWRSLLSQPLPEKLLPWKLPQETSTNRQAVALLEDLSGALLAAWHHLLLQAKPRVSIRGVCHTQDKRLFFQWFLSPQLSFVRHLPRAEVSGSPLRPGRAGSAAPLPDGLTPHFAPGQLGAASESTIGQSSVGSRDSGLGGPSLAFDLGSAGSQSAALQARPPPAPPPAAQPPPPAVVAALAPPPLSAPGRQLPGTALVAMSGWGRGGGGGGQNHRLPPAAAGAVAAPALEVAGRSSSASTKAVLSAMRALQEKIRRLEGERLSAEYQGARLAQRIEASETEYQV